MISLIRNWLVSMTVASIVLAVADNLMPEGTVKKIGKITGGLLMLIAVLQPIKEFSWETMANALAEYRLETQISADILKIDNQAIMKTIIEGETSAYLQNKAESLNIICSAETICKTDDSGNIYPFSVVINGHLTPEEKNILNGFIERELAIPKENIRYEGVDEK